MRKFSVSPKDMLSSFWRNRALIVVLVKREVAGRYRGSFMGILWSFFNPVFMLAIYTFVFSSVFKARWGAGGDSKAEFALVLFAGLMVFNLFAECITRAPGLILSNVNYVKKVVFPLEILPWVTVGASLFHSLISLGVWLIAYCFVFGMPHATIVLLPLVIAPLILIILGISWGLASVGVYMRDTSHVVGILTTGLMFLSPILYPASAIPEKYRALLFLNPLTPIVEGVRSVLFWAESPDWYVLAIYTAVSMLVSWLGFAWFQKTRQGFADVL